MSTHLKVLIADDEQACIDFVRDSLADTLYTVVSAMDGEEALQVAREEKPDLIILDVQMPKCDGFAVFSQLRADQDFASVPIIMLTGVGERTGIAVNANDMGDFLGAEPDAYIDKPIEPIILKQTVRRLMKDVDHHST